MKKIIFSFIIISLFVGTSLNANAQSQRRWWATLIVDAGGALGGAAAGGDLCFGHPYCIIGGGIIGGAAASLAKAVKIPVKSLTAVTNPQNKYDNIGMNHNKILIDYLKTNSTYKGDSYGNLINANKVKYELGDANFDASQYNTQVSEVLKLNLESFTVTNAIEYLLPKLPKTVKKDVFTTVITKLLGTANVVEFNKIIVAEENKIITDSSLSTNDVIIMSSFFSTMRYSAAYWNGN